MLRIILVFLFSVIIFQDVFTQEQEINDLRKIDLLLNGNPQISRQEAIKLAIELLNKTSPEDYALIADLNDRIGLIYDLMRLKELSKIHFQKSLEIREEYNLKADLYKSYLNLAIAEYRYGNISEALNLSKTSFSLINGSTSSNDLAEIHFWISSSYNFLNDDLKTSDLNENLDSALFHSNLAKESFIASKDSIGIIKSNNLLASLYTQKNRPDSSIRYLTENLRLIEALEKMRTNKLQQEIYATTYSRLSQAHELKSDYKSALTYSNRKYSEVVRIIMNQERIRVAELTEEYRAEKKVDEAEETAQIQSQRATTFGIVALVLLLVLVISYLIFLQTIQRKKLENLQAVVLGEEQERKRLAKDLHDGIGVLLTSIRMRLSSFEEKVEDQAAYHDSLEQIDNACTEVRRVSHNLSPASLEKLGLEEAILDLVDQIKLSGTIQIKETLKIEKAKLTNNDEVLIYRIVQELINNSLKYAEASELQLSLTEETQNLKLLFSDNGKGFDKQKVKPGLGLKSIASRIDILKGKMSYHSQVGLGTQFDISIPLNG